MTERRPGRPKGQQNNVVPLHTRGSQARVGDSARVSHSVTPFEIAGRRTILGGSSSKCSVCNHRDYIKITELLVLGRGWKMILASLPEDVRDPESRWYLTIEMLRHHVKAQHLPLRQMATQSIVTERLGELGVAIEERDGVIVDQVVLARVMVNRYFEHLAKNPDWVPETSSVVSVMKMLNDMERDHAGGVDAAAYNQVLGIMVEAIRSVVPDRYDEIIHRVTSNPVVKAIVENQQKALASP